MTFRELQDKIITPHFYTYQVRRLFPEESDDHINTQLSRFVKRGELIRIKRGLYVFSNIKIDELSLAQLIYSPSCISLETALNIQGVIPDITASITSVTTQRPRKFINTLGTYSYSKIDKKMYFGFNTTMDIYGLSTLLAEPEKALLDLFYLRKVKSKTEFRINRQGLNQKKLIEYSQSYPEWVKKLL